MPPLSSDEYAFKHVGNGVYVRKCFGTEALQCRIAETMDGSMHLTISAALKINGHLPPLTSANLRPSIHAAWIALRYMVPGIACKVFELPDLDDKGFAFRYSVPFSPKDAEVWVKETVFFSENIKPLHDAHLLLKDNRWWPPTSCHYVTELHLSPSEHGWNLSMSLLHSGVDGRTAFTLVDLYLRCLKDELEGRAAPISSFQWGTETVRLQLPGAFALAIAETGYLPNIVYNNPEQTLRQSTIRIWHFTPLRSNGYGHCDGSRVLTFSRETTTKLNSTAKRHGRTMSQLLTALCILAHAETSLRTASAYSTERFREVVEPFNNATHYLLPMNAMSHRHKLSKECQSFKSYQGSPLSMVDETTLLLPMDVIRALFEIDETKNLVKRIVNQNEFWYGLVSALVLASRSVDYSLDAYLAREAASHVSSYLQNFDASQYYIPVIGVSSVGDLGQLKLFNDFLPENLHPVIKIPTLIVEDIMGGARFCAPLTAGIFYQYNGRLTIHSSTSGAYTSDRDLELQTEILREWVDVLTAGESVNSLLVDRARMNSTTFVSSRL